MRFMLLCSVFFSTLVYAQNTVTLVCKGADDIYFVDLVNECNNCMELNSPHPSNVPFHKAYIIINKSEQQLLGHRQFIYEEISNKHFFADLRTKKLFECQKKTYSMYLEGRLERIGGIGGESTGMGLVISKDGTYKGLIEVTGSNMNSSGQLLGSFGDQIGVYGHFIFKTGVERGMYRVFAVDRVKLKI